MLNRLGPSQHWVDIGAGKGDALQEYLNGGFTTQGAKIDYSNQYRDAFPISNLKSIVERSLTSKARVTGISYSGSGPVPPKLSKHLKMINGKRFEDIPNDSIGPADLITDVYGAVAYSFEPDRVIQKMLNLLHPHGAALIQYGGLIDEGEDEERNSISYTTIITNDGQRISMKQWLQLNPTVEISVTVQRFHLFSLVIKRIPGVTPKIPRLELVSAETGLPPTRVFKELQ